MTKRLLFLACCVPVALVTRFAAADDTKAKKPTVCLKYTIAVSKSADDAVGICYDNQKPGKRPTLFYRFEEKEIPGETTGRIKVLVGWR